jgi:hypothetical protein
MGQVAVETLLTSNVHTENSVSNSNLGMGIKLATPRNDKASIDLFTKTGHMANKTKIDQTEVRGYPERLMHGPVSTLFRQSYPVQQSRSTPRS